MHLSIKHYITAIFILIALTSSAQKFTFALITDMHSNLTNTPNTQNFVDIISDINNNKSIEFVLIAGDVTDKGDSLSLEKAKSLLNNLETPYYISFGNHDILNNTPNNKLSIKVFGDDKFSFTHKNVHFIGFSTYPEQPYGEGNCSKSNLKWIDTTLNKLDNQIPIIAITHYPLQKGDINNWNEVINVLNNYRTRAVLHGHYHRNALLTYNQLPGIVNRSTIANNQNLSGYSVYSIDQNIQVYEKTIGEPAEKWLEIPLEQ